MSDNNKQGESRKLKTEAQLGRRKKRKGMCLADRPCLEPNAAGIDIGAREIFVAVPPDREECPVRVFNTFTEDLHAMAGWLKACGVTTVAMESTGVYWIPLYDILEAHGIRPCLTNARHMKNVPGRRTDWHECQWLQYLHSVGLLRAAFRPETEVCAVRSIIRHRGDLIQMAVQHVQHMQKALTQMNLQISTRDQRHDRGDRASDCRCDFRRRARSGGIGEIARPTHQGQRGNNPEVAGGQLATGAVVRPSTVAPTLQNLSTGNRWVRSGNREAVKRV